MWQESSKTDAFQMGPRPQPKGFPRVLPLSFPLRDPAPSWALRWEWCGVFFPGPFNMVPSSLSETATWSSPLMVRGHGPVTGQERMQDKGHAS